MNVVVRLQYAYQPVRAPVAWFIMGRTADVWLEELIAWDADLTPARLHVIPTSLRDRTPCGVLVLDAMPRSGKPSPRTLPYGSVGSRLFLPIDATLDPDLSTTEVDELLEYDDDRYVWHPHAGLVTVRWSDGLRVKDLLLPPQSTERTWDAAVPGIALNSKLLAIVPTRTPTVDDVLAEGRSDIGTQPLDGQRLPPAVGEPASGLLGDIGRGIENGLARAAQWLADQVPVGSHERTWANALADWARQKRGQVGASMQAARHREILRLLSLLQTNPDEGLRFALPMGGGEHRGLAAPSTQLGRRTVDFNLNQLGGGRAADVWDVPPAYQWQLAQRYRELAAREIALGRHRRAAYIFATLLNDLQASAATLADGGHYREAAMLYDERLRQPLQAALCLKKGGHWAEAIAVYERLGEHETIGDLYAELEQPVEAAVAWRQAVAQCMANDDVLKAAHLLEQKLLETDEAYEILRSGWPRSKQAGACLTEAFRLLARHERHRQATVLVSWVTEARPRPEMVPPLVEVLATEARNYPDVAVRERAADAVRITVADRLTVPSLPHDEAQRLVSAIGRLVPEDRLLARDAQRFLQERHQRATKPATPRPSRRPSVRHELTLPTGVEWKAATATEESIFLAGTRACELVVVRTDWNGAVPEEPIGKAWIVAPSLVDGPVLLVGNPWDASPLIVHMLASPPVAHQRFFKSCDRFPEPMQVGAHRGLSMNSHGACSSGRDSLHVVDVVPGDAEALTLVVHAYLSEQMKMTGLRTLVIKDLPYDTSDLTLPIPCLVRERHLYVGLGANVVVTQADQQPEQRADIIEMSASVRQCIGSAAGTRSRIAVTLARGGVLLWGDGPQARRTPFASDMVEPRAALARDGSLIAASKDEIDIYSTSGGHLQRRYRWPGDGAPTVAVLATRRMNRFAIVHANGRLEISDVPS